MGLFDDLANLGWRYKAILPIFTSLPYMVLKPSDRTAISLLLIGVVEFGTLFFIFLVPIMVTVVTNSYNQLGGLNGLEVLPGLVILIGLSIKASDGLLMVIPILCLMILAYLSYTGKAFIGNVGTFSIGLTLVVYAILMDIKLFLLISITPHILNSLLILSSNYVFHDIPNTFMSENGILYSKKARSLRTLILSYQQMTEHQVVLTISLITTIFTCLAFLITG
jgi:UDP-N-acetylmuramyl pentapeptide phosphotransferase/UDP-N-acetylglucosamine-1-phosphate transferase